MTIDDVEILDLFDLAVRPMRPELPDELVAELRIEPLTESRDVAGPPSHVALDIATEPMRSGGSSRPRSAIVLAAAAVLLVAGLALTVRNRPPGGEEPVATGSDQGTGARVSGSIADALAIDFSRWLVNAPAWPVGQPQSYVVFDVTALVGWTQLDDLGSHTVGQGTGYVWSSNVNDPDGRQFHVVVASGTDYPTVVSDAQPVDINGIAGSAGEGEVSWPLDATHTAVVTEFGTSDVQRAVELARQLTTTTVSSMSTQQPAGSVTDAVPDPAAQFAGSVDGIAWSVAAAGDGLTIIVDGIVREFWGAGYDPTFGVQIRETGNNDHCVFVAAYLPSAAYTPRLILSDGAFIELPVRPVDDLSAAFAVCVPYALDAVRVELIDASGAAAGGHDLHAPYLRPTAGGAQTEVSLADAPAG
jgi:hypothetical protein